LEAKIRDITEKFSKLVLAIAMIEIAASTMIVFVSTILRYFFGISFEWAEELLRYLIICAALIGSGPMIIDDTHIVMDFFSARITNPKLKFYHSLFSTLLVMICALGLFVWGCELVRSAINTKSYSLIFSMSLPYSIVPISMAVMVVFCILKISLLIATRRRGEKGGEVS
jgi:C4-dicarboxylate transporter DctQ subunit